MVIISIITAFSGCGLTKGDPAEKTVSEFADAADSYLDKSAEGSGGGSAQAKKTDEANGQNFNAQKIVDNMDVKGYPCSYDEKKYLALVLKNNTDMACKAVVSVDLYNGEDIIDTEEYTIEAFSGNTENCVWVIADESFTKYTYEIKASEMESYITDVNSKLSCQVNMAKEKAIVSVTNNGDIPARFVDCTAIFFKGDEVIDISSSYCENDDGLIPVGDTEKTTINCYEDFDSVKVYVNGYGDAEQ